jgi:lipoprotein-anchoring transpeptidase ErfK/SrfK
MPSLSSRGSSRRTLAASGLALVVAGGVLSGCQADPSPSASGDEPSGGTETTKTAIPRFVLTSNAKGTGVPVDRVVRLSAENGTLDSVAVTSSLGELPGKLNAGGTRWQAQAGSLEPGLTYTVKTTAKRTDGKVVHRSATFHTQNLTLDDQVYAAVAPLNGETVGVGMPVIATFDLPVTDKKSMERHMHVTASPAQKGAWHWISDQEAHWRPVNYWKAGSKVDVDLDVNSVPSGDGRYGQEDRHVSFNVGDSHIYRVNMVTDEMHVFSNGQMIRTIPITTGEQPKYTTRSGVKVIIEKFRRKRMNSETVGIDPNGPDGYDIAGVEYAMRVTYSGEFVHAAPWSVAYQGSSNVSHGCTGMSTENAGWLYNMSRRGDVVEYTGTDRQMTLTNGYGDWNESFSDYRQGSALS